MPVRVVRISQRLGEHSPLRLVRAQIQRGPGYPDPIIPFRPFELHRSSFMNVYGTIQVRQCMGRGAGIEASSVDVTYRVLGVTRHSTVDLPEVLDVQGVGTAAPACA